MHIKSNCKHSGFTLIELMIVIAILGILMAIAIPAYQDYTVRAKVAEAMNRAGGLKAAVVDYYNSNNAFPSAMSDMGLVDENNPSEFIRLVHINNDYICVHMRNTGEPSIDNSIHPIRLKPTNSDGSITWECGHGNGVSNKFFADACRNTIN